MFESAAVNVESFEDAVNGVDRDMPVFGPEDDVQVFLADFQAIEDAVEQERLVVEGTLQQAVVAFVEFHPKAAAFEVLDPPRPQIAMPVSEGPLTQGHVAEVVADFLAFEPLEAQRLGRAVFVDATAHDPRRLAGFGTDFVSGRVRDDHRTASITPGRNRGLPCLHGVVLVRRDSSTLSYLRKWNSASRSWHGR